MASNHEDELTLDGDGPDTVRCKVCGSPVPRDAHVCLRCGVWIRTGPAGLYVTGALKALATIATGVALPLVLLFASRRFDVRTAQSSRTERLQQEQTTAITKAAADARDATLLSIEIFEFQSRIRTACDEYIAASAIAHESWLGPSCATSYLNAVGALDEAIGRLAYRIDELPVSRVTVEDMRRLSEAYWGAGKTASLRQDLISALHTALPDIDGVGLKYCGPLIGQTPDRRAKCDAQQLALQLIVGRISDVTNVVFCGLSHDLAEFRRTVYELDSPEGGESSVSALLAKRLRENAANNVCSTILMRAHGAASVRPASTAAAPR
jgi:hypothetical protein